MRKLTSILLATLLLFLLSLQALAVNNIAVSSGSTAASVVELTAEAAPTSFYVPFGTITAQSDLDPNEWYYEGVNYCLKNKIMDGYDDGTFRPTEPTTRAMLVQILWNLEKKPRSNTELAFNDVSDQWFTPAVRWATEIGLVIGYDNGDFGPEDIITREQMAAILYRYAKYKTGELVGDPLHAYEDAAKISDYAVEAMEWACGAGVIIGTSDTMLSPLDSATRAQIATIMMRYMTKYGGAGA